MLWKIHGDWRDRRTRILSEQEYEKHYEELRILLGLALTNRPALFLGSSLDKDRTVEILAEIRRSYQGVSHFAILQAPSDEQEFDERVKEIRRLGIAPIWYPEHQHTEVEQWLAETIDSLAYRLSKGYVIKAGERYHMFSYRAGNPHKGQLVYRDPDGGLQIVERPFYFRQFSETCTILFKFHGGQHLDIDLPVTYVFTHRDFIDLAKLLPEIVPWIVFDRLKRSPLLFLGHRLQDDSVESLMRELNIASPARRSWAIQIHPIPEWRTYWKEIKVEIIDSLLQTFIIDLDKEVEKLLPARQSWERQ